MLTAHLWTDAPALSSREIPQKAHSLNVQHSTKYLGSDTVNSVDCDAGGETGRDYVAWRINTFVRHTQKNPSAVLERGSWRVSKFQLKKSDTLQHVETAGPVSDFLSAFM